MKLIWPLRPPSPQLHANVAEEVFTDSMDAKHNTHLSEKGVLQESEVIDWCLVRKSVRFTKTQASQDTASSGYVQGFAYDGLDVGARFCGWQNLLVRGRTYRTSG